MSANIGSEITAAADHRGISCHRQATDAAAVCKSIVLKTAMNLQGRKYVRVEGWQAIANYFGCVASATQIERTDTGFRATGQVRRASDGAIIAEAEGFVGDDELKTWAKRPEYAKRAMAQTRAISRACRSAFAFVVTMMDAGLSTTPAEEMGDFGTDREPAPPTRQRAAVIDAQPAPRLAGPAPESERAAEKATEEDMQRSRLAVNRAKDVAALEDMRDKVEKRLRDGYYVPAQADELLALVNGRIDILVSEPEAVA
jgi:hypothetical protein